MISPIWAWIDSLSTRRRNRIGIAVFRVGSTLAALHFYLADYSTRHVLFGPRTINEAIIAKHGGAQDPWIFSLYSGVDNQTQFEVAFHAGVVVALLFLVLGGAPLAVLHAVFLISLQNRAPEVLDGGDNLIRILLLFLPFTVSNDFLSFRRSVRRERSPTRNLVHNLALMVMVLQTCAVYFTAGMWKIAGPVWHHGYALDLVTSGESYGVLPFMRWPLRNALVLTVAAYVPMAAQVLFAPAVLFGRHWQREIVVAAVALMHLGIMAVLGLVGFGLYMLAADTMCLRDEDYRRVRRLLSDLNRRRWRRSVDPDRPSSAGDERARAMAAARIEC